MASPTMEPLLNLDPTVSIESYKGDDLGTPARTNG